LKEKTKKKKQSGYRCLKEGREEKIVGGKEKIAFFASFLVFKFTVLGEKHKLRSKWYRYVN
jgi:hypothetical protein